MKKQLIWPIAIVLIIILALVVIGTKNSGNKEGAVAPLPFEKENFEPYPASMRGQQTCLPKKMGRMATEECMVGAVAAGGYAYALDFAQAPSVPASGWTYINASGTLAPPTADASYDSYDIVGILYVTDFTTTSEEVVPEPAAGAAPSGPVPQQAPGAQSY